MADSGYCSGGVATMSQEIVASFAPKKTYIAHGEAFAPLFCLFHESQVLRGASVMWMMDNLGVLSCLCNGSSAVADIGCVVYA
eukprot:12845701-Heterocapsa_arctica.AAC.1